MTCEKCSDLCVRVSIKRPHELRNAIRIAWQNILDNTLSEIVNPTPISSVTFAELAKGDPWDDLLSYSFQCTTCGERFHLNAETYHGSGGSWEPENKQSIRESL